MHSRPKRQVAAALLLLPSRLLPALLLSLAGLPAAVSAQPAADPAHYPNRAVKIVVPFAAGGPADLYARFLAQRLQDSLRQNFVVENKPGGGSLIGTDQVAKSPADGYTLLLMSNTHTVNESLFATKPYALWRDFAPVAPINYSDLVLVARPNLPAAGLPDLLRQARANPGKLSYASSGPGTPYHMAGELFKATAAVSILHIPYKGSSGARADVLGGQVDLMFDAVPTMAEFIRSGKVKGLATTGRSRSAVLPDLPTVAEAGVAGYEAVIWLGLLAPRDTPQAIIERLNSEVTRITADPEVAKTWARQGATPLKMSPVEFQRFIADDIAKWARIVKISGAKPDQ
ncbi:MAG: tctC [Paucimonas sp.]|nr:tctC [Paucimonas sp.]